MSKGMWRTLLFGGIFVLSSVAAFAAPNRAAKLAPQVNDLVAQPQIPDLVGGHACSPGEWPSVVDIQARRSDNTGWSHRCSGVILSATRVLTTASCVDGISPSRLRIVAGIIHLGNSNASWAQRSDVSYAAKDEGYNDGSCTYANDIAVVGLAQSLEFNERVQPATLPPNDTDDFVGEISEIAGWGNTSTLQCASIPVISTAEASAIMSPVAGAWVCDSHLAVYDPANNVGFSHGDSGGPVFVRGGSGGWYLAGIESWGITSGGIALQTYPSVATRVSAYLDWISNN